MTVAELIAELQKQDPKKEVWVEDEVQRHASAVLVTTFLSYVLIRIMDDEEIKTP